VRRHEPVYLGLEEKRRLERVSVAEEQENYCAAKKLWEFFLIFYLNFDVFFYLL
jgi:hypothetical protein